MKMPAFQFYPADWRKDPGVQALSRHDQSVWFDMLCIMHESNERGVLLLAGRPMPEAAMCRMLGLDAATFAESLANLLSYGVVSRREDGALYNRRMVRDEAKRQEQAEYGKKGGNPALCANYNVPGFLYVVQRASDGWVKIGISADPSKRLYKLRYQRKGDNLELLASVRVEDMGKREAELHQQFKHRASGEWFALNAAELDTLLSTLKGKSKADVRPSSSSSISSSKEEIASNAGAATGSTSAKQPDQRQGTKGVAAVRAAADPDAVPAAELKLFTDPRVFAAALADYNPDADPEHYRREILNDPEVAGNPAEGIEPKIMPARSWRRFMAGWVKNDVLKNRLMTKAKATAARQAQPEQQMTVYRNPNNPSTMVAAYNVQDRIRAQANQTII